MDRSFEEIEFLSRSPIRIELLERIREEGPVTRRELGGDLDVVRTTLQRNLDQLVERGWIRLVDVKTYSLSSGGEAVLEDLLSLAKTVRIARRFEPFLEWFPAHEHGFELAWLSDAELVVSDPINPYTPMDAHIELLESAEHLCCMVPALGRPAARTAHRCVVQHEYVHELIVGPEAAAAIRSDSEYVEMFGELTADDSYTFLVADGQIPFYLGIGDGVVQIGVEDDQGVPKALVETRSAAVREWAEETLEEYRRSAEELRFTQEVG